MKKNLKKVVSLLLAVVMLLAPIMIVPFIVQATDTPVKLESYVLSFWADPENTLTQEDIDAYNSGTKTTMNGAVAIHKRNTNGNYFLFLPSNSNCNSLKVWFNGTATVNGTVLNSGEATSVFSAVDAGGISAQYTLNLNGSSYSLTVMKSGDVATMYIDTNSGSLSSINGSDDHSVSEGGTVMIVAPDGTVEYDGEMEKLQGRGNATWSTSNNKNPYNIKLATSTSLLGMGKAKKWVLLANNEDAYLIKDQLTYDFAKYIGIKYQPTCKPIDVYANQMYLGSYQLSEKVEIKSTRVDVDDAYENLEIANGTVDSTTGVVTPANLDGTAVGIYSSTGSTLKKASDLTTTANAADHTVGARAYSASLKDPTDVTGGYVYELEISNRWVNENAGFCAYNRQGWVIKSCDYVSKGMLDYSYNLLYALGSAVYNGGTVPSKATTTSCSSLTLTTTRGSSSITNPAPATEYQGKRWSDILDADSAVKYYWTQEYFKNMDSSTSSTYFYKDSDSVDGTLYAGPVWDMDHSIDKRMLNINTLGSSRWGYDWRSATGWYTKNARIYAWRSADTTTSYSSDKYSPLNFYAALATNCTDFWQMAEQYWYTLISPATQILLGNAVDETGTLKSVDEYIDTVTKSALMNNARLELSTSSSGIYDAAGFDAETFKSEIKTWFTQRNNFINSEISTVSISNTTVSAISAQTCTGSAIEPKLNITYNGVTLVEGTDYTIEYSNNTAVTNNAIAKITGIGYYTGTKTVAFVINAGTLSSATINERAYAGDTLSSSVTIADDIDVSDCEYIQYQWNSNGVAIDGANSSEYTLTDADMGKSITLTVTGDGTNMTGTVTSNACAVENGNRPQGITKTIASWNYDYTVNSDALVTADETGQTYYYTATSGENADTSQLTGSVNATSTNKLKWSGTDLYDNDSNTVTSDQTPIMGASKSLTWGEYPYFETVISTSGYQGIHFSARLGGTKKAPRDWKLQYSLDGVTYTDVEGSTYSISKNKTMELAFDNVSLPSECDNKSKVYIRMVACADIAISGSATIIGSTGGDSAVNNISVTGESLEVVTHLDAPTISTTSINEQNDKIFNTDSVTITDNNGGATLYYSVDDSEEKLYEGDFNPFDATTAKQNDTATIKAWAQVGEIKSDVTTYTVSFAGVNLNDFSYSDYSKNVSNGYVFSVGGVYGESGKMSAYTDGNSQYVPLWNSSNGAYSIAPDDGALWTEESGFTFEISTAGYKNVCFTAQMYTTAQGPNSVSLQYSLDGKNWVDTNNNFVLPANKALEQAYMTTALPDECANKAKVYIRVVTAENLTNSGTTLHNNASKGNLYINNVVVSGDDDGTYKMPYTNKTTSYFGNGTIKYISPDGTNMQYLVTDSENNVIVSGTYPQDGINIAGIDGFNDKSAGMYTVSVWAGDDDDRSIVNTRTYYYKGETVVKFNYSDTKRPLADYLDATQTVATNTSGANTGALSMYPNGETATMLSYSGSYGVKVSWTADNIFASTKKLNEVDGNGYWLITASTKGYTDLTLNLEQLSSNKGPRDWGIAYSLDGKTYKYLDSSNVRAISNDSSTSTVETYNNLALPAECADKDVVYIKVFINGGESVDGTELELVTKGNTGINAVEISGVPLPQDYDVTITTVAYEDAQKTVVGTTPIDTTIVIDGNEYKTENGSVTVSLTEFKNYSVTASVSGTFPTTQKVAIHEGATQVTIPVVALDMNGDGYVNAKDYAFIKRNVTNAEQKKYLNSIFDNFLGYPDIDM